MLRAEEEKSSLYEQLILSLLLYLKPVEIIEYDSSTRLVKITLIAQKLSMDQFARCAQCVHKYIAVHHRLVKTDSADLCLTLIPGEKVSRIEIKRLLNDFFRQDITIIIELITQFFGDALLSESGWLAGEEAFNSDYLDMLISKAAAEKGEKLFRGIRLSDRIIIYANE